MKKKLIEVALPLEAINAAAVREKSIRHGHPSTLHLWWARRPLAACRAVIFASLVDDPSARPEEFPSETEQERERERLFRLIEALVVWENSGDARLLEAARIEIEKSLGTSAPSLLDPFCGGGSIPLEAQRLGLQAEASDLNPVAVLLTKALVELPARVADRRPVGPQAGTLSIEPGPEPSRSLADDVQYFGEWMAAEAKRRIGHLYPEAQLEDGSEMPVIAWLWARTVPCGNPACGATIPLLNSFALCSRAHRRFALDPVVSGSGSVDFGIVSGSPRRRGNISRRGVTCLECGESFPLEYVREEGREGRLGRQLASVVAQGRRNRVYLAPASQPEVPFVEVPADAPLEQLSTHPQYMGTPRYGLQTFRDFFTARQLVALTTFSELVTEARERVVTHGGDSEYADAIATYLGLTVGRLANRGSSQAFWEPGGEKVQQVFARQALPMVWFFAEANPFSESSGNFLGQLKYLVDVVARCPTSPPGRAQQLDAATADFPSRALVVTDPPYYDNVPYADLSDFFYVWLRRSLRTIYPSLFSTLLTPKTEELVADSVRFGGRELARAHFESRMSTALTRLHAVQAAEVPMAIFYAFRQAETTSDGGTASTGWETMLEAVLAAGLTIEGTWPIRTEQTGGLRELGRNALASSIVLVCRRRKEDAPLATRRDFTLALRRELPDALRALQAGNVAPVDLAQAAIGPGMAIFSRFDRIVETDGSRMTVRPALALINSALDHVLAEQEGDFDADTRFALTWFEQFGLGEARYGEAETLSKAKNTSVAGLVEAGFLSSRSGRVRLLSRHELAEDWDPLADDRLTVWEVTQYLIRALEQTGEESAADLLRKVGGLAEPARELAYRLYSACERKGWAQEGLAYNGLIVAWPELATLAGSAISTTDAVQESLGL